MSTHASDAVRVIVTQALHRPDRRFALPESLPAAAALDLARAALASLITAVDAVAVERRQTPDAVWQEACLRFAAKTTTTGDT